jgi:hypothetical protein
LFLQQIATPLPKTAKHTSRPKAKKRSVPPRADERTFERVVATGVRKFILKDATIRDFFVALRSAARKNVVPPHPLSALVLSRIVKESMEKRKKRRKT